MDLGLFGATCVVIILCLLYIRKSWNKIYPENFPPGPQGWPLIGNLHMLNLKKPHLTYLELAKTYGPVFSVQLGMKKTVILAGYETVKDALVNHAKEFGERAKTEMFESMDKGMGLTFSHGDNWKVMRRFTIATLRDLGMGKRTIEDKITEECENLLDHFASFQGKPFEHLMIMNGAVANIIMTILRGHRMNYEDPQFKRLLSLSNENVTLLGSPMVSVEKNSQSYFHNGNLLRLVRSLISAGTETTSTTLCWGILLMAKYPSIQEKVQEEISEVVGSVQVLYSSHRVQMPFTNAVIHEIQRFSDIVPLNVPRETTKDVAFKGYFIPKGTHIIPLLTSVLKDKTQFERPDEFYPNHFLDAKGNFIKKDAFMAFSAGRRACAGQNLARMELFIFFTSILQKFTIRLPPGANDISLLPRDGFTNAPRKHMICAIPRF